jgi:hypothetical protein
MPIQVASVLVRAMSGTELSRVRTEFRLRPPERINQSPPESRGRHCYAIMWIWADFHLSGFGVNLELNGGARRVDC